MKYSPKVFKIYSLMPSNFDNIDLIILQKLQANAKITNAQLAQDISLSPASTLERVRKLENQAIIKSYYAKLDPQQLSLRATLWLQVRLYALTLEHVATFQQAIANLLEVVECYQVIGNADFFVKVITIDIAAFQTKTMPKLGAITAIKRIKPFLISATLKETGLPIIDLCKPNNAPSSRLCVAHDNFYA